MSGKGGGGRVNPEDMFRAGAQYNRINEYTPFGSVEYSGPNNTIRTETMSPEMLALMNQQMGLRGGALSQLMSLYGAQPTNIGNPDAAAAGGGGGAADGGGYGSAYGDIIGGLPGLGQGLPELGQGLPGIGYNLDLGSLNPVDYNLDLGSLPGYQNLDLSQLQEIPGGGDLEALRGNTEQALFERSRNLLDPIYNEQESRLNETYANRGMPVGAEERTQEFDRFAGNRSNAYQQAANEAVIGGRQEVNDILANAMGLRGQGLQEQMSLFGTGMQGRQQGLQELLSSAGLGMQGREQTLSERLAQLGAESGARGQLFGEQMGTRGQLFGEQTGTRQQLYNELMGTRGAEFSQLASMLGLSQPPGSAGGLGGFTAPGMVDTAGGYNTWESGRQGNMGFWSDMLGMLLGG